MLLKHQEENLGGDSWFIPGAREELNLKRLAIFFFQDAIRFHPGVPQTKALTENFSGLE